MLSWFTLWISPAVTARNKNKLSIRFRHFFRLSLRGLSVVLAVFLSLLMQEFRANINYAFPKHQLMCSLKFTVKVCGNFTFTDSSWFRILSC